MTTLERLEGELQFANQIALKNVNLDDALSVHLCEHVVHAREYFDELKRDLEKIGFII